jgi:ferredoxin
MRKIVIDPALCIGCGICVEAAPHLFSFQGDGRAQVIQENADDTNADVEQIASDCPTEAIEIR